MALTAHPGRSGINKYLTLEVEAVEILKQLSVSVNCQGRYISRLILEDRARREERERLKRLFEEAEAEKVPG